MGRLSTAAHRIGMYRITAVYRVSGGVVRSEANGAFFDDAGFAYRLRAFFLGPAPWTGKGLVPIELRGCWVGGLSRKRSPPPR